MANTRARVDVVVAEGRAHQLLDEESLFVRASRRCDTANGVRAVLSLQSLELAGRVRDRLLPRHFLPRVGDLLADHRVENTVLVRRVTPGEAALHATVTVV